MRSYSRTHLLRDESGAFIVLFAILLVAFLVLVGIGIDVGNMYRVRRQAQNAVDAAAFAAASQFARDFRGASLAAAGPDTYIGTVVPLGSTTPSSPGTLATNGFNAAKDVLLANFTAHGITERQATKYEFYREVDANNLESRSFRVTAYVTSPIFFLKLLRGVGSVQQMDVHSRVRIPPAVISLILDVSGSMLCTDTDCTCAQYDNPGSHPECLNQRKIDRLEGAVTQFCDRFDFNYDRMSITVFSLGAGTLLRMGDVRGFDRTAIPGIIASLDTATRTSGTAAPSATNAGDGLFQAFDDIYRISNDPARRGAAQRLFLLNGNTELYTLKKTYVFFSDGAPNAGRFRVGNALGSSGINNSDEFYTWAVDYPDETTPLDATKAHHTMGPLIPSPGDPPTWDPLHWSQATAPVSTPACSGTWTAQQLMADPGLPFKNCLGDFGFMPFTGASPTPVGQFGNDFDVGYHNGSDPPRCEMTHSGDGASVCRLRSQFYRMAIEYADLMRSVDFTRTPTPATPRGKRNVVYAVGLGPEPIGDPGTPAVYDPYQNILDNNSRKDRFMRRLAKDRFSGANDQNFPNFPVDDSVSSDIGLYLPTTEAAELRVLFDNIAKRIKLTLIE